MLAGLLACFSYAVTQVKTQPCILESKDKHIFTSKAFQHARTLPRDDPARKALFREARAQHAFSEYALHAYAQPLGHTWLGEHLDSLVIQTLSSRAYRAANRLLLGQARRVRFKGRHQLDTVEGKTNTSGIRWCGTHVEWTGLLLPARLDTA